MELERDTIYIFTDGSSARNEDRWFGGWAAVLLFNEHRLEISGGEVDGTIGKMELTAILKGLESLKLADYPVKVFSDSEYAVNCIVRWSAQWRRSGWTTSGGVPVENRDVVQAILDLREDRMSFGWIRGHDGNEHNERADALAGEARRVTLADERGTRLMQGGAVGYAPFREGKVVLAGDGKGGFYLQRSRTLVKLTMREARAIAEEVMDRTDSHFQRSEKRRARKQRVPQAPERFRTGTDSQEAAATDVQQLHSDRPAVQSDDLQPRQPASTLRPARPRPGRRAS